ncbi:hypothetical protein NLJ89_g11043 [Agrocybe chaxingu]|uniref:Uncharacterized protein n=1 Tax=Agrocybe chaxingu TaxID=84603 RepID=A0A9W8JPI1_9AGAR|nr:hypothetical protein NLJ89_g11043 [Agrocybe chaxingu]
MAKGRIPRTEHEAALDSRLPPNPRVSHRPEGQLSRASDTPYSYYPAQRPQEPSSSRKLTSVRNGLPESPASPLERRPSRLKKKRTFTENSPTQQRRPSTAPTERPPPWVEKDIRSYSTPERPRASSSPSTSKQNAALASDFKNRSLWLNRRVHNTEQEASSSSNEPMPVPPTPAPSYDPSHLYAAPSWKGTTRSKASSSVSTRIDEEEFLSLADTSFPSPQVSVFASPGPPVTHHRPKQASEDTSLSFYSQLSGAQYVLRDAPMLTQPNSGDEGIAHPLDLRRGCDEGKGREELAAQRGTTAPDSWDRRSTRSVATVHVPKPSRESTNTFAGWVGYDAETQSLRTIDDGGSGSIPTIPSEEVSRPITPVSPTSLLVPPSATRFNGTGSSASSFTRGTPPRSPTSTLVAGASARLSAFSETSGTVVGGSTPASSSMAGKQRQPPARRRMHPLAQYTMSASSPRSPRSSRSASPVPSFGKSEKMSSDIKEQKYKSYIRRHPSTIFEDAICIDYDYAAAVDILIYGIKSLPDAFTVSNEKEEPIQVEGRTSKPVSRTSTVKSRQVGRCCGTRVWRCRRGNKKPTVRKKADVEPERKPKKTLFSQVSQLFTKA